MAAEMGRVMAAAAAGFRELDAQLARSEEEFLRHVQVKSDGGNGNIAHDFALDRAFRLVFVRCHFSGGAGTASFVIRVRSRLSADWDTVFETLTGRGTGADVILAIGRDETSEPSPWTFQAGDTIRCEWTNPAPGTMKWGLEVGMAVAS